MAFTKTPTQDTYDTKRFPIVGQPLQRDGVNTLKDQRFLNCFPEKISAGGLGQDGSGKIYVKKRAGISLVNAPGLGESRGMIFEDSTSKLFFVVGNKLCRWNGTNVVQLQTLATATNAVGFTVHLTTAIKVILLDGTNGYSINPVTEVVTQITDIDFPSPHLPFPVSLDGYLFVVKAATADIYNSDLDNELSWTPGNFITAEMYPDNIVALTKNNNYIYAIGTGSVEYFYDAAVATGSPLARNDSAIQQFGTPAPFSVIQTEKEVVCVGTTQNGGRSIWLIEGFKADEISIEPVNQSLDAEGTNLGNANAYCIRSMGHKFYVLRLATSGRTWVYDFMEKTWHEWASAEGSGVFIGRYAADSGMGFPYMLSQTGGKLYSMLDTVYQDDGQPITMQVTTLKLDFDSMNRKDVYRFALFGDWPLNTTSTVVLDWSDNDYQTWVGNRTIQLSQELPVTRRLGKFRRRAFRITHTDNVPVRLEGMELDINIGGT